MACDDQNYAIPCSRYRPAIKAFPPTQYMRVVAYKALDASTITRRPTRKARISSVIGISPTEKRATLWSESPQENKFCVKGLGNFEPPAAADGAGIGPKGKCLRPTASPHSHTLPVMCRVGPNRLAVPNGPACASFHSLLLPAAG